MKLAFAFPFPSSEILDSDCFLWTTLAAGRMLSQAQLLGTCSCDPPVIALAQVTVEQGAKKVELIHVDHVAPFPAAKPFEIAVDDLVADAPVRLTVHVHRMFGRPERDARGRLLRLPEPVTFLLVLQGGVA